MRPVFALPLVAALLVGCVSGAFTSDLVFHVGTRPDGTMYVEPPGATAKAGKVRLTIVNDDLAAANAARQSAEGKGHDVVLTYHLVPSEGNTLEQQRCFLDQPSLEGPEPSSRLRFWLLDAPTVEHVLCLRAGHDGAGATYTLACRLPGHTERGALTVVP